MPQLRLNVVGKVSRRRFEFPAELQQFVRLRVQQPYLRFYRAMFRSYALLPMIANPSYFEYKSSSTIGASLATGVPLVADEAMLTTYSILDESTVFVQRPGEGGGGGGAKVG